MSDPRGNRAGRAENPYVGPRPFRMNEVLYGREKEALALFNLLMAERIVLLYSPSGSGKTSLIQANLVPQLQARHFRVLGPMRVGLERVTAPDVTQSHSDVNQYLASALQSLEAKLPVEEQFGPADLAGLDLACYLHRRGWLGKSAGRLAMIFDQFEEILTVNPNDRDGKCAFFERIGELLREPEEGQPIWALFSMREEYIAAIEQYLRPIPTRLGNTLRIDRLDADNAQLAIQKPAESKGIPFTQDALKQLVQDLSKEQVQLPGGNTESQIGAYIEPVQLQVVCRRLWEKLPLNTTSISQRELKLLGEDVSSALGDYYNDSVKSIAAAQGVSERDLRRWIELKLITEQGIRSQALKGAQDPGLERAISALVDAHLVRSETRRNATWYELSHDRLVDPVRKANKAWFQQNKTPLQRQAALWEKEGQPRGLLLSGEDLEEGERWVGSHFSELEQHEKVFLAACREARETAIKLAKEKEEEQRRRELEAARKLAEEAEARRKAEEKARLEAEARRKAEEKARLEAEQRVEEGTQATRKLRTRFWIGAAFGVVAVIALIFASFGLMQAAKESRIANANRLAAQSQITLEKYPQRSLLLAVEALATTVRAGEPSVPAAENALRQALSTVGGRALSGHEGFVSTLAISPDNHWLVTGSSDKTACVWDLKEAAGTPIVLRGHEDGITAVAISPDNRWLVTGSWDKTARLWDLTAKDPAAASVVLRGHENSIITVAISPDNHWLVTGSLDNTACLWDLTAKDPAAASVVLRGHGDWITAVAFSPSNHWLVTSSRDNTARLWDLTAKDLAAASVVLRGHENSIITVAISPDNHWLVTGSLDNTACLWDLTAKDPAAKPIILRGHKDGITAAAISPDNRWLLTGSGYKDRTARLWDLNAKDPAAASVVLRGHKDGITAVAISPDNRWLVTGSLDNTARLWDLNAKDPVAKPIILRGHENSIITVAISSDNRWLVTGSLDNTARLWDLNAKDPAAAPVIFSVQETGITAVAISPDNRWLVTGSLDNTARLWDLNAKDPVAKPIILRGHKDEITAVAISPDNRWLVTGSGYKDKTARLWDLNAKDPAAASVVLRGHEEGITAVAISPDNRWLVTGSRDKTARLWDLTAKDPATASVVLRGHEAVITAVAISPDNRWLVTGSWDKTARLWDLNAKDPAAAPVIFSVQETGITAVAISPDNRWLVTGSLDNTARLLSLKDPDAAPIVLRGHEDSITAAAFSRDKRWVVTGSADKTARLWNLKDPAAAPVILTSHENGITGVAFSPDNHWLVTVSGDKTARIWSLKLNELRELACRTAGRPLTKQEWKQYIGEQTYQKTCPNLQEVPEGEKR